MANLLGADIGTNYKGILSLDSTINTPLDATLRAVTDGEGNASGLLLSTTSVTNLGAGAVATNTAFGDGALDSNTTGATNTAYGNNALTANTTGSNNTSFGSSSLRNNTASNNTAVGFEAALSNTTGTGITAIGYQALRAATGASNTAVGFSAGSIIGTGRNNTIVGAGGLFATSTGSFNVSVGTDTTAGGAGTSNTMLGHNVQAVNRNGCVVLGREAIATADNQFVVGSVGTNAGAVAAEVNTSANVWNVIINGVARKILLA